MSTSAPDEISIEDPLCNSSLGSMVPLDYVTPLTGYEPKEMELTDADGLNLTTSGDIYFQNALDDTASFPNVPDVDDNELAEFLAVVVDRTGQLVEVRSNNDQFSCDIRNLKSAQSQFPLVTQPKRMISQTGGSVQERIAEERESSNAQIRTMLDEQRRTIIAEYGEKVLHHELLAAQAEQNRRILQEELLRQLPLGLRVLDDFRLFCCMKEFGDGFDGVTFPRLLISWRKLQLSPLENCPLNSHCQQSPIILCTRCFIP